MHISVRSRRLPAAAAALALVLAGCGSKTNNAQVATLSSNATVAGSGDSTSSSLSQADTEKAMLSFAACMRDKGVQVADPTFDANGNVQGGFLRPGGGGGNSTGTSSNVDFRSQEFQDAFQACQPSLQGVQFGGPGGARIDRTSIQNGLNSFTKCLRDKGLQVDDVTLPQGGAGGPGGGNGGNRTGANGGATTTTAGGGSGAATGSTGGGTPGSGSTGGGFTGGPGAGGPPPGGGPGGAGFNATDRIIEQLGLDANDPTVKTAVDACQPVLQAAFNQTAGSSTTTTR